MTIKNLLNIYILRDYYLLQLLYIHVYCLRYFKPVSGGHAEEDLALGSKMLYLSKQVNNTLQQHVEESK